MIHRVPLICVVQCVGGEKVKEKFVHPLWKFGSKPQRAKRTEAV